MFNYISRTHLLQLYPPNIPIPDTPGTLWPASKAGALPNCSANIRSPATPELSHWYPKPGPLPNCWVDIRSQGHSRTVWLISQATVTPELFGWYPKPGCSQTIRPLSEVGLLPGYPPNIRSRAITHSRDCVRPFLDLHVPYEIRAQIDCPHHQSGSRHERHSWSLQQRRQSPGLLSPRWVTCSSAAYFTVWQCLTLHIYLYYSAPSI